MDNKTKIVMKLSDEVLKLIDDREFEVMDRGDLQGVIEAIINTAYIDGQKDKL